MLFRFSVCFLIVFFELISCSQVSHSKAENDAVDKVKILYLHTTLKGIQIENNYSFCDTALKGEQSCFLEYYGNRYLKKEKCFCDSTGNLKKLLVYKPEGAISYDIEDLLADSLLVKSNMWKLQKNILTISGDSVVYPIESKIIEFDKVAKRVICVIAGKSKQLYIFDLW